MNPDILTAYPTEEGFGPGGGAYAVVYVRPETNTLLYERAIAAAIRRRGDECIYAANLNGELFRSGGILQDHYVTQLAFASDPRAQLAAYPEIGERLARRFGAPADELPLVGSFRAAQGRSEEELFETFVAPADFLACWGQQFKRIGGVVVANPGLPAVLSRYTAGANVFVVVVRSPGGSPDYFSSLNRAIYEEITSRSETPLVDGDHLGRVPWPEKVRRTYHISRTHLMAMFDMADLVYVAQGRRLALQDTPLGRKLLSEGTLSAERLLELKRGPLRYARHGGRRLHYLPLDGEGRDLAWVPAFLRRF